MADTSIKHDNYTSDDIQVLEGLEAVRKRPGMYIGTTSAAGLHHLVWEIIDNSVDEALAGYASHIEVSVDDKDVVTVVDDGRGMPTEIHPKTGKSTVETIYTVLHAGGKFGGGAYKVSGGLHGVGASVVNALSKWLVVTVRKNGKIYQIKFEDGGKVKEALKEIGTCDLNNTGSAVSFKADEEIFKEGTVYNFETLYNRIRQMAFLNKGIRLTFNWNKEDEHKGTYSFCYEGGIKEYIKFLNENEARIFEDILYCEGEDSETSIIVEAALQYNTSYTEKTYAFCNNILTPDGGTHLDGFRQTLARVINAYAKDKNLIKENDEPIRQDDLKEGLTAIISVKHPDPQYEGQTKGKLGNAEVKPVVNKIFGEYLKRYLLENPDIAKLIIDKAKSASEARLAAQKARESVRRKDDFGSSNLPTKLKDCASRDASICEIYIVEGNSAGGSAQNGRDSNFQAILPLRGKVLNVEKARMNRILDNAEIRMMIKAFGCGFGNEIDLSKLRYHKIVIMTDADVDGQHIATLMLTFLYRYFKPLIEEGYVYIAMPPLYKLFKGQKTLRYCYSDEELEIAKRDFGDEKYDIQRYKGLGEMDASQLWETTLDPERRTLKRVTIEDAIDADQVFSMLMGDEVEPRKNFIIENAHFVKNLDI
ncbi:MAG: DNA topoisomerase (ATP-hydrolyzing) subunit B [Solobacterium sp.]|nr:DNA topoisomerase (ATP-hydrolyzing) subunit B [Erysipelotrichaceae bacterium]MCI7733060.1 DNA topoisomerase (ATP-hydrolyzing) subunit B [Solobacterium sp.]MDD5842966.1 DNA topoisomerase (ATP-hydrolyzing) subunit B [Solobacterium sp.]MDD5983211.1 DNA topoisomerase (ATP-hydrolyzing) subunit B [Solobacterium sp.]MDD6121973.1 DNA topoisomerase (ATP-hydrolyzing) subunit B [Solobacterium sp.]